MKRKIFYALGVIAVAGVALAAVANGPYYAMPHGVKSFSVS
jgi:hypothetical protein